MELIESCKRAIDSELCLGCQALENPLYKGNPNCEYSKIPTAEETIKAIKARLGVQEKINM